MTPAVCGGTRCRRIGDSAEPVREVRRARLGSRARGRGAAGVGRDSAGAGKQEGDEGAEDEAADVGEEGDTAAVRLGAEESEVRLDKLVQEPEAEEEVRLQ